MVAAAQSMNSTIPTVSSNKNLEHLTFPGQTIVHSGIVSNEANDRSYLNSTSNVPNGVSILPQREDAAAYTGVLTFTATVPVEIGFGHRLHVDNSTLSQIETIDDLPIFSHNNRSYLASSVVAATSVIIPDYGTKDRPPYFSASIPFTANSVWLRSPNGEPFTVVYDVAFEVVKPQLHRVDVVNATR